MDKRIKQHVVVNGEEHWITGYSTKDLLNSYLKLCIQSGLVSVNGCEQDKDIPLFGVYMKQYYDTYKNDQQTNTILNRNRIINNHIVPKFGNYRIDKITITQIQKWFNILGNTYSHQTLLKIKNVMSPVFDSAIEDGYISIQPLKSKKLKIGGKQSVHHKALPKNKMDKIRQQIMFLEERERYLLSILSSTGMRFEQVLGLRWQDIDFQQNTITIKRAVVHPQRNKPQIKDPKTKTSNRTIPLPDIVKKSLHPYKKYGFVLHSKTDKTRQTPLSYTESRKSFEKIRKMFDIKEYSPHDFRDTCATEWRQNGLPLDMIARLLGHAKTETTQRRYIKYRTDLFHDVKKLMDSI